MQLVSFVLLGLLPKFGALAQIIPSPVLGGAMLVMFGFVSIQGMQILARVDFANNEHNFLIAAVSIAAGVDLNGSNLFNSYQMLSKCSSQTVSWLQACLPSSSMLF